MRSARTWWLCWGLGWTLSLGLRWAWAQEAELTQLLRRIEAHRRLVWSYHAAWLQQEAARNRFRLPVRPPEPLPLALHVRYPVLAPKAPPASASRTPFALHHYHVVRRYEQAWFQRRFGQDGWAYLGSQGWTPLDTLPTPELRARLQAHFGAPTRTLAETELYQRRPREEYIQFEYWFVLNDSIPLRVLDVNGPFERGIVVASAPRYREQLKQLRAALLDRLITDPRRAAFADYYFQKETDTWYVTGFDGRDFWLRPMRAPRSLQGRPPVISTE
ncbi:hypothetical protein HRbin18_00572 [bacterium HR18]|nr:hypothetical protein HRbin18_00572 [bacterium HR18]